MTARDGSVAREDAVVPDGATEREGGMALGDAAEWRAAGQKPAVAQRWQARLAAGAMLLAGAWLLRAPLEASMLLHMAAQLPTIVVAGVLCAQGAGRAGAACARWWSGCDAHGLAGLTWLLLASAYWMVPRALEQALSMPWAEAAKFASLFALGLMLPGALRRANTVIQLFFLGNFSAMMAIAGMLYQDLPQRLCNAYSLGDQVITGTALVAGAVGIAIAWCIWQMPAISGYAGTERRSAR